MTTEKMMDYLYNLPAQFEESLEFDYSVLEGLKKDYHNILVSGLGGSAIGGDILKSYALKRAGIPVLVNRDYDIPAFVNEKTLFFAVSYSGNTEETLSAYQQARKQGADIVCLSSGGKLLHMAAKDAYPLIKVPGGLAPRAATAYLFAPLLMALERIGLLQGARKELQETIQVLETMRESLVPEAALPDNQAKTIALKLKGSIPIIWGTAGISETAALRWKAQINENAKSPAYYNAFPELNHNELVGFEAPEESLSSLSCIILRDKFDNERVRKRMEVTKGLIKDKVNDIIEVYSQGESFLARFYSLVYTGDYASVYLALEYGINPTPVRVIDYLKSELAKQ
jgi:glucose/mannose-6-phosphate isomerase